MLCNKRTEVYSRIVGYFRPIQNWNEGKKQEFVDRREYDEQQCLASEVCAAPLEGAGPASD